MKPIKIISTSMKTTPLGVHKNGEIILNFLQRTEVQTASIVLFPELCVTGYGCEDGFYFPELWRKAWEKVIQISRLVKNQVVVVGIPFFKSPFLYNIAVVMFQGKILGLVPKQNLANTGIHYEARWFKGWEGGFENLKIEDQIIPFGNLIFQLGDLILGVEICEDSWVVSKPSHSYTNFGTNVILSLGASHFSFGKQKIRDTIFSEVSRSQESVVVYSNLNGNEAGKVIYEGGAAIYANGEKLSVSKRLFFSEIDYALFHINLDQVASKKAKNYRSVQSINKSDFLFVYSEFQFPEISRQFDNKIYLPNNEINFNDFTQATSIGLFDYLVKSKTKGFTIALSGGADSAVCLLLVYAMKLLAKKELGPSIFEKLGLNEKELIQTAYLSTVHNSENSQKITKLLTEKIGNLHHDLKIDHLVDEYKAIVEKSLGLQMNWKEHDIILQNIQARVRSPLIWMLANTKNHLLISTGNRSELSVGYMTMDGDTSGSISPLAGVSKDFLLKWLTNVKEGKDIILVEPIPALELLLKSKPTAELRPLETKQEDEKDLMPYEILDEIENNFIFNNQINKNESLQENLRKYYSLFQTSQWKRERTAPAFHLDKYGLDPKTSFRFPILSDPIL